jgi:hypothetical protein
VTPLERLLQEEIPVRPEPAPTRSPWTPEQQAQHRTDLLAAIDGWEWDRDTRRENRRHLRLIRDAA